MSDKARFWLLFLCLFAIAMALAAINLQSTWREAVREAFLPEKRVVLAEARGNLIPNDQQKPGTKRNFLVLKIQTRGSISLEVFEIEAKSGQSIFRARATLPEGRDGQFDYHGNATNLLLLDINNDGGQEIIAPAFDENLIPRVHVYRFNDEISSLELLDIQSIDK
jgi:hypothetical protein